MNVKLYSFRLLAMILVVSGFSKMADAQDVYWREGFQSGEGFPSAVPFHPTYVTSSVSGTWYNFLFNRTNGATGSCTAGGTVSADHARFYNYNNYLQSNPDLTIADSGFAVTPVVDFGIKELHFRRGRVGRRFTIYKTGDTLASTANWVLVAQSNTGTDINQQCIDTVWTVDDPAAKRLKIVARSGTDSDIDSVWMVSTSPIVPVKFTGVSAASINGLTKVSWTIATEINTRSYIIEKSTDGAVFTKVAEVPATNAGNYSWIDASANSGLAFYRVKAVDKDGLLNYSGVVKISFTKGRAQFTIAPNVVRGRSINLQLNELQKGALSVNVSNTSGQVVYRTSLMNEGGAVTKTIQLPSSINAGTYRVQVLSGTNSLTQPLILQ